ncbi:proline-rich protein 11 isoform X2 [Ahaetulla prasina]|uniref:proline-rich protein 11 isoform X2 n=1 Tax=Ahaetulla prasina TaxID=499056 RepID=UPI00264888F2|nr:proline-rich protein 11 isoform X2 [Ahaetulla prasina]
MARVKRRRSRTKSSSKGKKHTAFTSSSSLPSKALPPTRCPVILHSQRRPFSSWLLAFRDLSETLKHILAAGVSWCWWFQRHVAQILHVFVSTAFPSHTCLEELKELRAEVENLKREVAELQSTLQNGGTAASAGTLPCQISPNLLSASVHAQLGVPQPTPLPLQNLQIPIPPPPPPPPPLLPPPPPPAPLVFKRRSDPKDVPLKKEIPLQITAQDLLNVKLKKTKSEAAMDKETSTSKGCKALITLRDLQSIRLQPKAPQPLPCVTNFLNTPNRDGLDFRKHLKKVAIKSWLTRRVPLLPVSLQETALKNRARKISWWSPNTSTMDTLLLEGGAIWTENHRCPWGSVSHAGIYFFPSLPPAFF